MYTVRHAIGRVGSFRKIASVAIAMVIAAVTRIFHPRRIGRAALERIALADSASDVPRSGIVSRDVVRAMNPIVIMSGAFGRGLPARHIGGIHGAFVPVQVFGLPRSVVRVVGVESGGVALRDARCRMDGRDIVVVVCRVPVWYTFVHAPHTFIQEVEPGKVAGIGRRGSGIAVVNGVPDVILLVIDHRGDGISTAGVMIEETPRKKIVSSVDRVGSDYERETRDEKANEEKV